MEANKENSRKGLSSRIPLPKDPLPRIPSHLIKGPQIEIKPKRIPLRTLHSQPINNLCFPSTSKEVNPQGTRRLSDPNLDTRHVTERQKTEDLDWSYKVFNEEDETIISLSDDESYLLEREELKRKKQLDRQRRAKISTPIPKSPSLQNDRIRHIKKSLKRPHSRELTGLTPKKKKNAEEKRVGSRRVVYDGLKDKLEAPNFLKLIYMSCNRDYCSDIFSHLLSAERKPAIAPRIPSTSRACIINWLMKVNGADGNPAVLQAAIWYLDSILAISQVKLDKMQLVAAACFWIAQKLHGPSLTAERLVTYSANAFTSENLLRAEKLILTRLKFPPQPVVPQEFITYLSWWCDSSRPGEIEIAATFLCMCGMMVSKALCDELPSVISEAAVHNALILLKKRSLVKHLQKCPVHIDIEKKTENLSTVRSILRKAVRTVTNPLYEFKAPFEHYDVPPLHIAQRVADSAREIVIVDAKLYQNTSRG